MIFKGETAVVLGSGPSLTAQDVAAVQHLRRVAVNTTWELDPLCDVLFAGDNKWWCQNGDRVNSPARRVSLSYNAENVYGATRFKSKVAKNGYNSGCVAIEYALRQGASKVLLLGFDCSVKHGVHHHGKHPKSPNPDAHKCQLWMKQFDRIKKFYPSATIINCSRYTELETFEKSTLEDALCALG